MKHFALTSIVSVLGSEQIQISDAQQNISKLEEIHGQVTRKLYGNGNNSVQLNLLQARVSSLESKVNQLINMMNSGCEDISSKGTCNRTMGCKYSTEKGVIFNSSSCKSVCAFYQSAKRCAQRDGCTWYEGGWFGLGRRCEYDFRNQLRDVAIRVRDLEAKNGGHQKRQQLKKQDYCLQYDKQQCSPKLGCVWNNESKIVVWTYGGSCESMCANFTEGGKRKCLANPNCHWFDKKQECMHKFNI